MKKELHLEKIPYKKGDLSPVMSEETIKYHRDNLAASYVNRFNEGKGDLKFNEAGAFLHNIFFTQLTPPSRQNKPYGACLDLINDNYGSFDAFKEEFLKEAMSIQGSGWIYLARNGKIKKIKNHEIKSDIILLVDWWEHAWALDYQSKKDKYLENIWKIINWDVVNDRLNIKKARMSKLLQITKNL